MVDLNSLPLFLIFILNSLVIKGDYSCTSSCHNKVNKIAPLHFLNDNDQEMFSPPGRWFDLDCCADGFTDIQWYYHTSSNTTLTWWPWPWFKPCEHCIGPPYRELCDLDQKLQYISISLRDTGSYRCNVSNSMTGENILREHKLVVAFCDNIEDNIQFSQQPDSLHQPADLGSNLTLTCAGYFGCPDPDLERHANWSYIDTDGNTHLILPGEDPHYNVQFNQSYPDITVGSVLAIIGVEERDYHLKFQCNLSTSTLYKSWNLTLHTPDKVKQLPIKVIIISVRTVVFLLSALLIYCCYKPFIDYWWCSLRGNLRTRSADQEGYHDACIIHSEDSEVFVKEEIKEPLERENYDIFTKQMVKEEQLEIKAEVDGIDNSMCVILVLSEAALVDGDISFLASVAIPTHGSSIIVIDVMDDGWQKSDRGEELLRNLPKIVKTIKWRGKDKKNFLYEIKINLPKPRTKLNGRRNDGNTIPRIHSDSSSAPLLFGRHPKMSSEETNGSNGLSSSDQQQAPPIITEHAFTMEDPLLVIPRPPLETTLSTMSQDSGIALSPT